MGKVEAESAYKETQQASYGRCQQSYGRCERGEPHGPRCKRISTKQAPEHFLVPLVGPRCLPSGHQAGDLRIAFEGTRMASDCAEEPTSSTSTSAVGQQGWSSGGGSNAAATAPGNGADNDPPDPELERRLQANAQRIQQQGELIGRMLARVELLEAQQLQSVKHTHRDEAQAFFLPTPPNL